MTPLIDSHCHLQDPAFADDADAAIRRAAEAGLVAMLVCGFDAPSNLVALDLAARHEIVQPAVGFHPHDAKDVTPRVLDALAAQAALPRVAAVGEIGLDFYRNLSPHGVQRDVLDAQLDIAVRVGKPVSVHSRSAEDPIFEHLHAYASRSRLASAGRPVGVMHCFGGTLEQARRYVEIGFLVSLACTITYPANEEGRRIARGLPLESLVVETDSPYLPPQQLRGQRNEPAYLRAAVEALAEARGISFESAAHATTANAARLLGLRLPSGVGA
jgi:TatD DNase family protein